MWGGVIGVVIGKIVGILDPIETELSLQFATSEQSNVHVNHLIRRMMMVSLTNPTAVELFIWMGDLDLGQPNSVSGLHMGTMLHAVMFRAASSASLADAITN